MRGSEGPRKEQYRERRRNRGTSRPARLRDTTMAGVKQQRTIRGDKVRKITGRGGADTVGSLVGILSIKSAV